MVSVQQLIEHYRTIAEERMKQLPIYNPRLSVAAVGFREFDGHQLGVLITPWFMNMVLLPGSDEWANLAPGEIYPCALPGGEEEFTVCRDEALGTYLSAVLFRTVAQFPDQVTACAIAEEVLERLFQPAPAEPVAAEPGISRRDLLRGMGAV